MKFLIILLVLLIFISSCSIQRNSRGDMTNPFKGWPSEDYDDECKSDSDCVQLHCQNIGSVVVHKNALNYLDEFKQKFCDPEISYEKLECRASSYNYKNSCGYKDTNTNQGIGDYTDNLTKPSPGSTPRQPFSDDY